MSAMATIAEFDSLMQPVFRTKAKDDSGAIGIQFWIRGKPWHVVIDSDLLFNEDSGSIPAYRLAFADTDDTKKIMWGALLEKAWAKIKGNYEAADGGIINSGMRALSGLPVFAYMKADYQTDDKITELYGILSAADTAKYVMGFGTDGGGNDQESNSCGIAKSHAYTILAAFKIDTDELLLVRNPWGTTNYKDTDWDKDSVKWNDADTLAKVPLSVNPKTSNAQGIFVLPLAKLKVGAGNDEACLDEILIGHNRAADSFYHSWYDVEGDTSDGTAATVFSVKVPADVKATTDMYLTVDGYF